MKKMYGLIETFNLNGQFRWISSQMNRVRNGELYHYIADTKGAFVQPAVYEAFGLTVVEAMTYGLPTLLLVMVVQLRLSYMVNQASTLILIMVNKQLSSSLASLRSVRKTLLTGTKSLKEDWSGSMRSKRNWLSSSRLYYCLVLFIIKYLILCFVPIGTHGRFIPRGCWPLLGFMAFGSMCLIWIAVRAVVILRCSMLSSTVSW